MQQGRMLFLDAVDKSARGCGGLLPSLLLSAPGRAVLWLLWRLWRQPDRHAALGVEGGECAPVGPPIQFGHCAPQVLGPYRLPLATWRLREERCTREGPATGRPFCAVMLNAD